MLKRLLALFCKKKPKQKSFEEKIEQLGGYQPTKKPNDYDLTARVDRRGATHFAKDEKPTQRYKTTPMPERKNFNGQPRRGKTVDQNSSRLQQQDDMILAMAVHQTYVAPSPLRSHDDTCRVDHTPSYRHSDPDPSPSYDGGSDSGYSGGGGCD